MAAGRPTPPALLLLVLSVLGLDSCPAPCSCPRPTSPTSPDHLLDCSRKRLSAVPENPPAWITQLNMNNNELTAIPFLGDVTYNITALSLIHNRVAELIPQQLQPYLSLESLDLSSNSISELTAAAFPPMQLKHLNLSNNKISHLEPGCLDNVSHSLLVLRLNRNRITVLPQKGFRLSQLHFLELKRNRIKVVESLTFKGLDSLRSLKLQRNGLTKLMDGAFFGLSSMEELELEYNNLTEVSKGWLYGLRGLRSLRIGHNAIASIRPDAWEFCQRLEELDLSQNQLSRLEERAFSGLGVLEQLNLGQNTISHLGEGVFSALTNLRSLDIRSNEISWAIEDSVGVFDGMKKLNTLVLQRNGIKSITRKAFEGLESLEHLDLSRNGIMSVHPEAFSSMQLKTLLLNSSSLLCDCQLQWLGGWLTGSGFQHSVSAVCAHPASLLGRPVLSVSKDQFICDDFPKPRITEHPETQVVLRGNNVTLGCRATSSSDSAMTTAWRKDGEVLYDAEVHNFARYQQGELEYTSLLQLLNVNFTEQGRYQCVLSNHFGSNYSSWARLTVNELPSFLKTPMDLSIRAGAMARLECAAEGHPAPQIAWQKDGGTDFPAARERRMHVMPDDDIFFIANVKAEDMGLYSCTAQNTAGSLSANATLTVLETPWFLRPLEDRTVARGETAVLQCIAGGSPAPRLNWTKDDGPLALTERHFFAAANQLLIIVEAGPADVGKYTCIMSNTLGTQRGHIHLRLSPSPNCDAPPAYEQDGWTTVGIVIIVVVCCVVGTSLVWVIVIYHMRRKSEDYSITHTDEMNLPGDIPSCLSSQGTLSEPQEGYSGSEAGSHQQLMPPLGNGCAHANKGTDGVCFGDSAGSEDSEGGGLTGRGGSLFTPHSSFQPPDPREGPGAPTGAGGSLVICSDCYDNANIYSRTREYCPYAYLGEEPLEKGPPPEPGSAHNAAPRDQAARESQDSAHFLSHAHADGPSRPFWEEGCSSPGQRRSQQEERPLGVGGPGGQGGPASEVLLGPYRTNPPHELRGPT
ncbi:leucine-rich repeats and immunoglobulin-like domains protein 2 [Conger conger]|uniref:leucine-rich repeats and immunoglobulin-like domains protein 2 n=1 Tax=Conger conger TaxID=82655 RepID=UPI002A5A5065|nr:leucine-rich repeats and immunoglobulin-like domains protein 2 [Conger conger]